jgi:hypothetical protein
LSTSAITSSLLSNIAGSDGDANQFTTDLNQLAQDLQSGNLSSAQQDYVTLSQDALNGVSSSTSTSSASGITTGLLSDIVANPSSASAFTTGLNQLGADLENGNLANAQEDLLGMDATALNSASTSTSSSASAATVPATTASGQAQQSDLIQAIVQAMSTGDNSAVSSGLSQLASISSSSAGASILQQESGSFGSSNSSSSIDPLLQSLSSANASTLSVLG